MSEPYDMHFVNSKKKFDTEFFASMTKWLISKGWKYLSFWIAGEEVKVSLEAAVQRMSKGGAIIFMTNHHDLSVSNHGRIQLYSHPVNFEKNDGFADSVIETMTYLYLELKADKAYGALTDGTLSEEEMDSMYFEQFISCFNIFSPEIVKKINKNSLESIDAYRVEYLADGSLLLVLAKNPLDVSEDRRKEIWRLLFG